MKGLFKTLLLIALFPFVCSNVFGQENSNSKPVKHFFRPTFNFDYYASPYAGIYAPDGKNTPLASRLRQLSKVKNKGEELKYRFSIINFGFYAPLFTKTFPQENGLLPTLHVLATGNALIFRPDFNSINQDHQLSRLTLGIRAIYTDGYKSTLFVNFSPFISRDRIDSRPSQLRYWGTIIYNRTVNKWFSYRLGYVSSYLLADVSVHLPFVGVRIGRLDRLNVSIALPRNITVSLPLLENKIVFSVYSKPIGGIFHYNNSDSSLVGIHPFFNPSIIGKDVQFRFLEYIFGAMIDVRLHPNFTFYISGGFSTNRYFGLAYNRPMYQEETVLRAARLDNSIFVSFGCTVSFGKVKRANENYQMYDAFQVNSIFDSGDNNLGNRNFTPNTPDSDKKVKVSQIDYKEVKDLLLDVDN
ncbi:MAG: hypothetical protein SFY32_01675 [Bacteroidota bacterium]|nr:hypothetical protein [Bacteroidota bacterium]